MWITFNNRTLNANLILEFIPEECMGQYRIAAYNDKDICIAYESFLDNKEMRDKRFNEMQERLLESG